MISAYMKLLVISLTNEEEKQANMYFLTRLNKEQKEVLGMALFWAENSSEKCEKLRKLAKSKEIYKRKKYDGYRISQCSENTRKTIVSFNKIHYI